MLLVETALRASPIHGLGCFAAQPIKAGTPIWRLTPGFDVIWTPEQFRLLPTWQRAKLEVHAYFDKHLGFWVYCSDDARFFNHDGVSPTVEPVDPFLDIAKVDLAEGDELTCDYNTFCDWTPEV